VCAAARPSPVHILTDCEMAELVHFPDASSSTAPSMGQVGGKGMSLWRMSGVAGATVPDGFILSTVFFERWFAHLAQQPCWDHMLECCRNYSASDHESADALHRACEATKEASRSLTLDASQQTSIEAALSSMRSSSQGAMRFVAVRSSSPEEDLAGMSFAGGYESVLGVRATVEAVQAAVQTVFASCLDERVFIYKIQHDIADKTPRIAAVVQRQVASVVAGVAFSLDPLSNCYDWATINTNFGLGETVVGGQCSPDYYLVNKLTGKVLESSKGKKETTAWLDEGGGVVERPGDAEAWTLSPAEVATVVEQLVALESFYGKAPRPPLPAPTPPSPPPSPPNHQPDAHYSYRNQAIPSTPSSRSTSNGGSCGFRRGQSRLTSRCHPSCKRRRGRRRSFGSTSCKSFRASPSQCQCAASRSPTSSSPRPRPRWRSG